jgi:hypothetical protein
VGVLLLVVADVSAQGEAIIDPQRNIRCGDDNKRAADERIHTRTSRYINFTKKPLALIVEIERFFIKFLQWLRSG